MIYSGWEETMLKRLGIKERNPFVVIRLLLKIIDELKRKLNN